MRNLFQNKWFVAFLIIIGIAAVAVFLLLGSQKSVEHKGIALDRDKLSQRAKPSPGEEKESKTTKATETAPQREAVASVTQLKGLAFAEIDKEKRVLDEGSPVFEGDRIVTGSKARLILKMKDDAVIALGEDSEFLVQKYAFKVRPDNTVNEEDGNKGEVKLNKGSAKFTSGRLGQLKSKPFHMVTPVATMGVRGTEGFIQLNGLGDDQGIEVISLRDEVLVWMEEIDKKVSSSSGEILFLTALIANAEAADLSKAPEVVKRDQMLSGSKKTPPVVFSAPPAKLANAYASTAVQRLPAAAKQALADNLAKSLVAKGAASSVEEVKKILDRSPEALDKLVAAAEEKLQEKTKEDIVKAIETEKQLDQIKEEMKAAETSGDKEKLAELTDKKAALESKSVSPEAVANAKVDDTAAAAALEKTASKVEDFSKEVSKEVKEGKGLSEILEKTAREVKQEIKDQAKAIGIQDYDVAKQLGNAVKAGSAPLTESGGKPPTPGDTTKPVGTETGAKTGGSDAAGGSKDTAATTGGTGKGDTAVAGDTSTKSDTSVKSDTSAKPDTSAKSDTSAKPVDTGAKTTPTAASDPNSVFNNASQSAAATPAPTASTPASSSNTNSNNRPVLKTATFYVPPVMTAQTFAVNDDVPPQTIVGKLVATTTDTSKVLAYTLTPSDVFTVDSATGTITTVAALDYGKASSYTLTATVTDNVADTFTQKITYVTATITINLSKINKPPTVTVPGSFSVNENGQLPLAGVVVADPDSLLTGGDKGVESVKLEVNNGVLNLTDSAGVTVTAGASGSKSLTINGTVVSLNNVLGKIVYNPNQYYRGTDTLSVSVDDLGFQGSGGSLTASGSATIAIKPVNFPPVLTNTNLTFSVDENSPAVTVVGAVQASAPHAPKLTYAIAKGNVGNTFAIDAATGQITVNKDAKLDFETLSTYTLEVSVTDNNTPPLTLADGNAVVTIQINNVNEPPTVVMPAPVSVLEDGKAEITGIVIADPDITSKTPGGDMTARLAVLHGVLTLSDLTGATVIAGGSGSKSVTLQGKMSALNKVMSQLSYAPELHYSGSDTLSVEINDMGNIGSGNPLTVSGSTVITVKFVNYPPVFVSTTYNFSVDETAKVGTVVGSVSTTDIEKDPPTYAITGGNTGNAFAIDATTGQITVAANANLNYLNLPVYTLTVSAQDGPDASPAVAIVPAKVTISLKKMNRPPFITAPSTLNVLEETQATITGIQIGDPDLTLISPEKIQLTLTVQHGTLSVFSDHSQSSKSLVLLDTLANLTKALTNLNYLGDTLYYGADSLAIELNDMGNVGSGTTVPAATTVAMTLTAINHAPTLTAIADVTVNENATVGPLSFQVADLDTAANTLTVTADSSNPTLIPVVNVVISGTDANRTVTIAPVASQFGSATITLTVSDGSKTVGSTSKSFKVTVNPVADRPTVTPATTNEDVQTTSGLVIGRNSVDGAEVTHFKIANITNGTLFKTDGKTMIAEGDFITVDEGATGLRFTPKLNQNSADGTVFGFDVFAATGAAANKVGPDKATAVITVTAVNDAPVLTMPEDQSGLQETALKILGLSIADVDVGTGTEKVTLTVNHGKLTLGTTKGLTFNSGSNNSSAMIFSGTLADLNTALAGLTYLGDYLFYGTDTLTVKVDDLGNSGAVNTPLTDTKSLTITLTHVNHPPVVTQGTAASTFTETEGLGTNTPILLDKTVQVVDVDNANLTSATIALSSGFDPGKDLLSFVGTTKIKTNWNATTGVLTLTGMTTVADYQLALRAVTYTSSSHDPAAGDREITVTVSDGTDSSTAVIYTVTVVPINNPPLMTAGGTLNYTEKDAATPFDTTLTISDPDNVTMAGATVTITSGYQKDVKDYDVLGFTNTTKITGTWDATAGKLTLAGVASTTAYLAALKSVTFYHNGSNPTATDRILATTITDGTDSSVAVTSTVKVTPVNDAPVIVSTGAVTYLEKAAPVVIDAAITISDAEGDSIASATVSITGSDGTTIYPEDRLAFAGQTDVALAYSNADGITGTYSKTTGVLTLTGTATVAQYQAALATVTYANYDATTGLINYNVTGGFRKVKFTVTDTGTPPAPMTSTAVSDTVTVVPVNDPPVLTAPTATVTYTEDATPGVITPAMSIDPNSQFTVTDSESNQILGATIVLSGIPTTNGVGPADTLQFTSQNGITGTWSAVTHTLTLTGTASIANYQTALRSVTYINNSRDPGAGTRTLTWTMTDNGGVANGGNPTSISVTSSLTVVAVNDPPALTTTGAITYIEKAAATIIDSAIAATDAEGDTITGATVKITDNNGVTVYPEDRLAFAGQTNVSGGYANADGITGTYDKTTGILTMTGTATLAKYKAALATVTYANYDAVTGLINYNPTGGIRKVGFTLTDSGVPLVATSSMVTATVTVVPVNDPPVVTAPTAAVTYAEDATPGVITPAISIDPSNQLTITDSESNDIQGATITLTGIPTTSGDGPADTLQMTTQNGISATWDTTTHILTLTGTTTLANYQTALRSVTYINNSRDPGAGTRTLTWQVTDVGGSTNGGNPTSTAVTSSMTVTVVNDPPTVANAASSVSYVEDQEPIGTTNLKHKKVISSTATVTDPDNGTLSGATVTITPATYINGQDALAATVSGNVTATWSAGTGTLTLTGTDTKATYQTVLRTVTYQNTSDNPTYGSRLVQYVVTDSGGSGSSTTALASMQSTVTVYPINDVPVFTSTPATSTYNVSLDPNKNVATTIDSGVVFTDSESDTISGASVVISGNYTAADDVLSLPAAASTYITGATSSYAGGTLTITGNGTIAAYQAALRAVQYKNASNASPTASVRSITYTVTDAGTSYLSGGVVQSTPQSDPKTTASYISQVTVVAKNTTVGNAAAVAALSANANTFFRNAVTSLAGATPQSITFINDNIRTMILSKLNHQLTGSTAGISSVGDIIDTMDVSVTNTPKILVGMRVQALGTVLARLPSSVKNSLLAGVLVNAAPYVGNSTVDILVTVIPSIAGNMITFDGTNSKVDVSFSGISISSINLDTLISSYDGILASLKTDGNLTFFQGGGVPKYVVTGVLGSSGDSTYSGMVAQGIWSAVTGNSSNVPNAATGIRLDHYLPGKISTIQFNITGSSNGGVTLVP
ncbi:MAG: cadherin domain-containing protein [Magnetococcales bacterium]|nr:cadherin domain-containing protein [Magnetococcales bacterium]